MVRGKILIVEDTIELADLYALYLAKEGLECRIALDAESGLPLALPRNKAGISSF